MRIEKEGADERELVGRVLKQFGRGKLGWAVDLAMGQPGVCPRLSFDKDCCRLRESGAIRGCGHEAVARIVHSRRTALTRKNNLFSPAPEDQRNVADVHLYHIAIRQNSESIICHTPPFLPIRDLFKE